MSDPCVSSPLLGGLAPARFMRRFWQKQPLLVRGGADGLDLRLDRDALFALAQRDDVESRLVRRDGARWSLAHGPFSARTLRALPARDWTLLVQGVDHVHAPASALLARFDFVPHARTDDVMVSFAAPGGGVGPHFDSYDVFLVQGRGSRRWRVSAQRDLALRDDVPLKLLANFVPQGEAVLGPGDLLYLPPRFAHDGVAVDDCTTWSVGFRAPARAELARSFFEHVAERVALPGLYVDPDQPATATPGHIPDRLVGALRDAVAQVRWRRADFERVAGTLLSAPKPHVFLDPPARPLTPRRFAQAAARAGIVLDPRVRLLYRARHAFLDGEVLHFPRGVPVWLATLADRRALAPGDWPGGATPHLHRWYTEGVLHPAGVRSSA
ncbi:MAG: cupin domain-containing protein [Burkholderiales bacterium]|jgi:50S ribosomal protein L16 3-hydroxylase|nr:cupin domain-containing protein [Burkholderiales bacterium]